jgi:tripartite-type tricarboxylate transporter receptor subunit TctC
LRKLAIIAVCLMALLLIVMVGCTPAAKPTSTSPTSTSTAPATTTAAAWTPTKAVTVIVMNNPGGGYDTYTRGILSIMTKKFVNQPMVVQNVGGAGGTIGMVQLYRAKPDGYTLALMDTERRSMDVITGAGKDFDLDKITYIATCSKPESALVVSAKSPWVTAADVVKASQDKILHIATTDVGGSEALFPVIMGLNKFSYVTGYGGSADCILAVVKGDAELCDFPDSTMLPYMKSGDIKSPVYFGAKPSVVFEAGGIKVPTAIEAGFPNLASIGSIRIFIGPPAMDPGIQKYWEDTFIKTMNDPDCVAWSKTTNNPLFIANGADSKKLEVDLFATYNKYKDILAKYG